MSNSLSKNETIIFIKSYCPYSTTSFQYPFIPIVNSVFSCVFLFPHILTYISIGVYLFWLIYV